MVGSTGYMSYSKCWGKASCSVLVGCSREHIHVSRVPIRVILWARFAKWGVTGALDVWSLHRKSPGTAVTLPSLGFSGMCVSLSSGNSSELKLAPIIPSPEVIPEILSEHKHSLLWPLSTGGSLAVYGLLLQTCEVRSSKNIKKKKKKEEWLDFV